MAKPLLEKHAKAIELRQLGWSYIAIKKELQVSKGSLSLWLRNYPLTEKQIREFNPGREERRVEHFRQTFVVKRKNILNDIYQIEKVKLLPLTNREEYVAGLMLYWGEGLKRSWSCVSFSNTNPTMIKFARKWLVNCCNVPIEKLKVRFHYYSDMDIELENKYWQDILDLPISQFRNPYIKHSLRSQIREKGGFGHGTCDLMVYDTALKENILMGIKVIADNVS